MVHKLFSRPTRTTRTTRSVAGVFGLAICALVAVGCGSDAADDQSATDGKMHVVAVDRPIADLIERVAGPEVKVTSLVPLGLDGHTYTPRPEDAKALATADIFIENGLGLNEVVSDFARQNYRPGTLHMSLSSVIPPSERIATDSAEEIAAHGHAHSFNAHFWPDPNYAKAYVQRIGQVLGSYDAPNKDAYASRAAALSKQLTELDSRIRGAAETVPAENHRRSVRCGKDDFFTVTPSRNQTVKRDSLSWRRAWSNDRLRSSA